MPSLHLQRTDRCPSTTLYSIFSIKAMQMAVGTNGDLLWLILFALFKVDQVFLNWESYNLNWNKVQEGNFYNFLFGCAQRIFQSCESSSEIQESYIWGPGLIFIFPLLEEHKRVQYNVGTWFHKYMFRFKLFPCLGLEGVFFSFPVSLALLLVQLLMDCED